MSGKQIKQIDDALTSMRPSHYERRAHRRHVLEDLEVSVERVEGPRRGNKPFGRIIDLSAGGVRLRTNRADVRVNSHIRVRMELPAFAGICPFVDTTGDDIKPKREWTGWVAVNRVSQKGSELEVAGRLVDMDELDRGMLSLYLSTQPLAA